MRFLLFIPLILTILWILKDSKNYTDGISKCKHPVIGDCKRPCPWCEVYGFFNFYHVGERDYKMCKFCLKVQDFDKEIVQCYIEKCPQCRPDSVEEKRYEEYKNTPEKYVLIAEKQSSMRITMSPGHPCGDCGIIMTVWEPKENPALILKNIIYKEHNYT